MSLHVLSVCERLQVLISVRLGVRRVMTESLHTLLSEPFGLIVCVQMVGCGKILFETQHPAYRVKVRDSGLLSVIGQDVLGSAVCVSPLLQKCNGSCNCCSVSKRGAPRHFGGPVDYDQNGDISWRSFLQRAK